MTVTLNKYRDNEYMVIKDGVLKCKHKPLDKAKSFADSLSGGDYVDETQEVSKKEKKKDKKVTKVSGEQD